MNKMPPLNAVRAFEAAARHLSVTRAAEELFVTQAAVSHQIKALEDWFGVPLFRRAGRGIRLTEAGQDFFAAARDALADIVAAARRVQADDDSGVLTVTTTDSFASSWLVPRLRRFREAHPEVEIRLTTSDRMVDLAREDIDIAIRFGSGKWPDHHIEVLFEEDVFPVCSPALVATGPPLNGPADLRHHTLIHDDMIPDWATWLRAAGVADQVDFTKGPYYTRSNLVIQAAIAGEGIALGRSALVATDMAEGRLVKPFEFSLPSEYCFYFVCLPGAIERAKVAAFRDWLFEEKRRADALSEHLANQAG